MSPADGPEAPPGYAVVAFEVRLACGVRDRIFSGSLGGLSHAIATRDDHGENRRVVAVAWFAERPLDECNDTRWRLVSVLESGRWSAWVPEEQENG